MGVPLSSRTNNLMETMAEVSSRTAVDREHVLRRLKDWRDRVHRLYDEIERGLGADFTFDRSGKRTSRKEELVQRVALPASEVPEVDILEISRGHALKASLVPRALWIVGANGRLDIRIRHGNRSESWMLVDRSKPLLEAPMWQVVPITSDGEDQEFTIAWLRDRLRA